MEGLFEAAAGLLEGRCGPLAVSDVTEQKHRIASGTSTDDFSAFIGEVE